MTEKRDLKADLKSIQEGRTLFDDPDPSVGTKYELYEVAEQAIERAIKAEALVRELVGELDMVAKELLFTGAFETTVDRSITRAAIKALTKAKEVLGDG